MKYTTAVYIGRFEPLHNAHKRAVDTALSTLADRVIILVGSSNNTGTFKNPWSYFQRDEMFGCTFPDEHSSGTLVTAGIKDFAHDSDWKRAVYSAIEFHTNPGDSICLVGHVKDNSSYYLKLFPELTFEPMPSFEEGLSATQIREIFFALGCGKDYTPDIADIGCYVPAPVAKWLERFAQSDDYRVMRQRFIHEQQSNELKELFEPLS